MEWWKGKANGAGVYPLSLQQLTLPVTRGPQGNHVLNSCFIVGSCSSFVSWHSKFYVQDMKVREDGALSAYRYAPLLRRLSKFAHPRRRRF